MSYQLLIRSYDDPDYQHLIAEREVKAQLDRIEDGANINLNHEKFFTEIVEVDDE